MCEATITWVVGNMRRYLLRTSSGLHTVGICANRPSMNFLLLLKMLELKDRVEKLSELWESAYEQTQSISVNGQPESVMACRIGPCYGTEIVSILVGVRFGIVDLSEGSLEIILLRIEAKK